MEEPLAKKLAPLSIKGVIGQKHLVGDGQILTNLVANKKLFSMILYGPPGIGKTSIASALVNDLGVNYRFLNATIHNKKDFDVVISEAKMYGGMVLIMDEIHRLNKDKQDLLLPNLESGLITLIGMTTSNPYHAINPAIRSRCQIFELKPLNEDDIYDGLKKAVKSEYLVNIKIDDETIRYIAKKAKFDLRFAYNLLEIAYYFNEDHLVDIKVIDQINSSPISIHDKNEDGYYDVLSGLQKSIRGSDVNAALHYLGRLLLANDLDSLNRRLTVICYEDIGLANPSIGPKLRAVIEGANLVGMPEARILYAPIVIEMALSPKSNSANMALNQALIDIETKDCGEIHKYLKSPYIYYQYPHDYPHALTKQTYLPKNLVKANYYIPKETSQYEKALKERKEKIEQFKNN